MTTVDDTYTYYTQPLFGTWLSVTRRLQTETYGYNFPMGDTDQRADYFRTMAFAAVTELVEMSQEVGWKPWGKDRTIDRAKYLVEGVDVLHFVGNLLVMPGVTDEELTEAYWRKLRKNQDRQASGEYDGRVKGKCVSCHRELD